jgi:hypothetical protein
VRHCSPGASRSSATPRCGEACDRGRNEGLNLAPPSEPDWRVSRIRLSSQWSRCRDRLASSRAKAKEISPSAAK